jgi:ABC-type dipeptide/oligopeptide/nickel transport system ATPase component
LKSLIDHGYIYGFVSVKNQYAATFPDDLSKGQACIISGECGIGKTWFATRCIPSRFRDASIICYEVSDDDMQPQPQWNNMIMATVEATQIYQDCMKALRDKEPMGYKVYDAICEPSREKDYCRNQSAKNMMDLFVKRSLQSSTVASKWW